MAGATRITFALLLALAVCACAQERSPTCRTHKVSNGELTECD